MNYLPKIVAPIELHRMKGSGASSHICAEVALVDKSQPHAQAVVYILKDQVLKDASEVSLWNHKELFSLVGYVESIDKKQKIIHLTDQNMVIYEHMIVATGSAGSVIGPPLDEAFASGLQALIDALKIQKKVSASVSTAASFDPKESVPVITRERVYLFCKENPIHLNSQSFTIVHPHLFHVSLAAVYKWLFEVRV